jgi:hypothetical protein
MFYSNDKIWIKSFEIKRPASYNINFIGAFGGLPHLCRPIWPKRGAHVAERKRSSRQGKLYLPESKNMFLGLLRFVVSELDYMRLGWEDGLIDTHLRVNVDWVVTDVKELDDLRLWELFDYALSCAEVFDQLAGVL